MIKTMDNIYAQRLMFILLKPFEQQKAFKLGLIDKEGKELREPSNEDEELAYTLLHKVCFELKKIMNKLPGNEHRLKQVALALQILNRKNIPSEYMKNITEDYKDLKIEYLKELKFVLENEICLIEEEFLIEKLLDKVSLMKEEGEGGVVNSVTGISPAPGETPVINPKKKREKEKEDGSVDNISNS